jgi:nucleotide-binding universal stress UspA family protein
MKMTSLKKVFYPSDFLGEEEAAFEHALKLALAARGELSLMHVDAHDEEFDWSLFPSVRVVLERWGVLPPGSHHSDVTAAGLEVVKVHRRAPGVADAIHEHIASNLPDLVVLSTHQRSGLGRWLHRALAEPIARTAPAPTLFVPRRIHGFVNPRTGEARLATVLIPVDREPHPQPAIDAAAMVARTLGVTDLHFIFLHAGPESNVPVFTVPPEPGWTSEVETWEGDPVDHILASAEANEADLIVMAKRGQRTVLDALRGSTTERVVRGARCPVLVVPVRDHRLES